MASSGSKQKLLVLYGTETGNSESISKRIHQDALAIGYDSAWHPLSDYRKVRIVKITSCNARLSSVRVIFPFLKLNGKFRFQTDRKNPNVFGESSTARLGSV
jgi:sulfite reductase alpha subunit-like flavoprotein